MLSIAVNKEKEQGTARLLALTPLAMGQLALGKSAPYFLLSLFHTCSVWALSYFAFDIRIAGSAGLFFVLCTVFSLSAMSLGLVIAAWTNRQLEVLLVCWVFLFIPNVFLSGFLFPVPDMRGAMLIASWCMPGTPFIEAYRGIVFRGTGWAENGRYITMMLSQTAVAGALAFYGFSHKFVRK